MAIIDPQFQGMTFRMATTLKPLNRRMAMRNYAVFSVIAGVSVLPLTAFATDWVGTTSHDWFEGTNWSPATDVSGNVLPPAAPTAADPANVGNESNGVGVANGKVSIAGAGKNAEAAGLNVGVYSGNQGTLSITGGATLATPLFAAFPQFSNIGYFGSGAMTVDGAGSKWTNGDGLYVGLVGTGTLTISNGGKVSNTDASLGESNGANGTVTVTGAGSNWTNNNLTVGNGGNGTLTISDGGSVNNVNAIVANQAGSVGQVTVDGAGSSWTNSGTLTVGNQGAGTLTISNGGTVKSTGDVTVGGTSGTVIIGAKAGAPAVAPGTLDAPKINLQNATSALVFNHSDTTGNYRFSPVIAGAGSVTHLSGTTALAGVNTYTGKTTISGGTLRTDVVDSIANSNEVSVNGGVLNLNGNNQRVNRLGGTGGEVQLNGARLTVNNAAAADSSTFAGDFVDGAAKGGLTKTGDGSLTLSGKTGWTGDTLLDGGELVLDGSRGGAQLVSNIIAKDSTALSLRNGASLTGSIDPTDVNIDAASQWNMTADSVVNNVNLAGTINYVPPGSPMTVGRTLTANNWNGQGGTVVLNSVLAGDTSVTDKLLVNGNTSGNTFMKVNNLGGGGAQTVEGIRVVEVKGLSDGNFTKSGRIVAGAYDYSLVKNGKDWFLTSLDTTPVANPGTVAGANPAANPGTGTGTTPVANPGTDSGTNVAANPGTNSGRKGVSILRPESSSYTANLAAANNMFNTRLHDRPEATEYIDSQTGEKKSTTLWIRQKGGRNSWTDTSGQVDTSGHGYMTQLGSDIAQWSPDGLQRWSLGVMAGYGSESSDSRSDRTGYKSEGSVSGYSAGLYATWYENNETRQGMYFDSWAQYGWFDNDVKGSGIDKESYKSSGVTTSMELGYAHKLGEFTDSQGYRDEWFVEPQAQAIWMGVEADDHRESNGTRVSGEGDGNLQTRLGVRTFLKRHSKSKSGEDLTIQPYVDVNWIHNSEDFGVRMDNTSAYQNGARNIAEIKPGIEGQLTPSLSLRGNVGLQVGENGYDNKSATVGLDYTF